MNSTVDLSLCRVCLKPARKYVNLFGDTPEAKDILDKIYLCFQIVIQFDKSLPHRLCGSCIEEIKIANSFRDKCLSFDERLAAISCNIERENCAIEKESKTYANTDNVQCVIEIDYDSMEDTFNMNIDKTNKNKVSDANDCQRPEDFVCNVCNKVLKTKLSLIKHMTLMHQTRKHVGGVTGFGPTRRYHCTCCSYSTPHSQTLVNHMRRHDGVRPYNCQCGKSFTQSSSLSSHQKTHSNTTYFTCTECGKQFKHGSSLKRHFHVHESGKFTCTVCPKILKTKQSLQDHMYRHFNIHNYSCDGCGETFVTSSELISHKKTHNLTKSIECYCCGFKTHTKKSLILHLKRHTGDKQFKCEICDLTFYTQGDAKRHHRVHTREKPFGCLTCTQRFTYSTSLNKHMRTVHGLHYKYGERRKEAREWKPVVKSDDNK